MRFPFGLIAALPRIEGARSWRLRYGPVGPTQSERQSL